MSQSNISFFLLPSTAPQLSIASCRREDAEVCCSLWGGFYNLLVGATKEPARFMVAGGRSTIQSSSTRAGGWYGSSSGGPGGVRAVVWQQRPLGLKKDVPCSSADGRLKGAALTWLAIKKTSWRMNVRERGLWILCATLILNPFGGQKALFSVNMISVVGLNLLGCSSSVLCGESSFFLWDSQSFSE